MSVAKNEASLSARLELDELYVFLITCQDHDNKWS